MDLIARVRRKEKRRSMTSYTLGLDVSHHQPAIDWQRVAAAGYRYVFVRATYGAKIKDRRFTQHWAGAREAGLLVSAYHFMRTSDPVDRQVDRFLETLGDLDPDLPLALDVETDPFAAEGAPLTRAAWSEWVAASLERLTRAGFDRLIIYTAGAFWNANLERSERWVQQDLWVAHYTQAKRPRLPRDWGVARFWQYTGQGLVPGVDGRADLNRFTGSEAELLTYAGRGGNEVNQAPQLTARVGRPVNVRAGPSIKHDKVGWFTDADIGRRLPIYDIGGEDAWVRIGPERWCACTVPGGPLCRIVVQPDGGVQARVLARSLNVRAGPGREAAIVGGLFHDDVATVHDVDGNEAWIRWGPGKWTALRIGNRQFLDAGDGARDLSRAAPRTAGRRRKRPRSDDG